MSKKIQDDAINADSASKDKINIEDVDAGKKKSKRKQDSLVAGIAPSKGGTGTDEVPL